MPCLAGWCCYVSLVAAAGCWLLLRVVVCCAVGKLSICYLAGVCLLVVLLPAVQCCLLFVVERQLFVAFWLLIVVCRLLFLCVVCYLLFVICCLVFVGCWLVCNVVVCCVLFDGWCLLFWCVSFWCLFAAAWCL